MDGFHGTLLLLNPSKESVKTPVDLHNNRRCLLELKIIFYKSESILELETEKKMVIEC